MCLIVKCSRTFTRLNVNKLMFSCSCWSVCVLTRCVTFISPENGRGEEEKGERGVYQEMENEGMKENKCFQGEKKRRAVIERKSVICLLINWGPY